MINVFGGSTGDEEIAELSTSIRAGWMGMGEKVRQSEGFGEGSEKVS